MKYRVFDFTIDIPRDFEKNEDLPQDLRETAEAFLNTIKKYGNEIKPSAKKVRSAKKASRIKANKTKAKVQNAINLLRLEGKNITAYSVAKIANISYNTAQKYFKEIYKDK